MLLPDNLWIGHFVLPLRRPYVLSFGVVQHLDSFIAVARFADGTLGMGESCPLPGYSHETAALLIEEYRRLAQTRDLAAFVERNRGNPFVTAPVFTCLESPVEMHTGGTVEICPILQWDNVAEIPDRIVRLAAAGNRLAKVKITPDLDELKPVLQAIQPHGVRVGMRFRYDANQALTFAQAERVAAWLDHPTTELLEQPLGIDAWGDMRRLRARCHVSLMLDESIVDADSVERAAECADLIKLKLAKNGSPQRLHALIDQARRLGLDVVLGNGVQGTLGCRLEAHVQQQAGLTRAGEMNGFRKLRHDPFAFLLNDRGSAVELPTRLDVTGLPELLQAEAAEQFHIGPCAAAA